MVSLLVFLVVVREIPSSILNGTKLSVTYDIIENQGVGATHTVVGFSTGTLMKYTGGGIGTLPQIERVNMEVVDNELKSDGSDWDQYLQPDNLHGIKLYREPYDRDIDRSFCRFGCWHHGCQ